MAGDTNGARKLQDKIDQTQLKSSARTPILNSQATSPAKLAPNHSIFMANIDGSPTKRKIVNDGAALLSPNGFGNANSNSSSSTRVIESLHEQIDTLTNTNIQLTVQSHSLLNKLESAQQRESKLLENTSSLKHENDNLVSMLNRKARKLKDLEEESVNLKKDYNVVLEEKRELQQRATKASEQEKNLEQQVEMIQVQYDALVDSQQYYKKHYKSEITTLKEQLEILKAEQLHYIQSSSAQTNVLDVKLLEFDSKFNNMQELEGARVQFLEDECEDMMRQLDLSSWVNLYKESKNVLFTYAEKMQIDISQDFKETLQDPALTALESKPQYNKHSMFPLKLAKSRSNMSNTSPNANTYSNISHSKRSSFYGGTKQFPTSALPGTLPGVKRTSSRRKNSGKSDYSSASTESSPILQPATPRNASTPSSRMSSASSYSRRADSMVVDH